MIRLIILLVFTHTITGVSAQNSFNNNEFDYDSVPAFKECSDKVTRLALRRCFERNFDRHIDNFFRYPEDGGQGAVTVPNLVNELSHIRRTGVVKQPKCVTAPKVPQHTCE